MMLTGERVAAFFDVDHTLIACNSGRKWLDYLWKNKQVSISDMLQSLLWLAEYRMSLLDFEAMTVKVVAHYAGQSTGALSSEVGAWFEREIAGMICKEAVERIHEHHQAGDVIVLLTSGTSFSVLPLAQRLCIQHLLCTQLEEHEGRLTGKHVPPACFGHGKVFHAERFAEQHGIDLFRSYFYTDSYSDLPMLMRVGKPRVVNPDPRLRRKAVQLGWGFERWSA